MRSRSSLLSHILGSHREVDGHAEQHLDYLRPVDLRVLKQRVGRSPDTRFVLDKVLHDSHRITATVLARDDVHSILLVRQPAPTIASIVAMGRVLGEARFSEPAMAVEYYVQRLQTLGVVARTAGKLPPLYVAADSLVSCPERVLALLTARLGLRMPLSPNYKIFDDTGVAGRGDFSAALREGTILNVPATQSPSYPEQLLERAEIAYRRCTEILDSYCVSLVS